jgi:hypothetical protein
VHANDFTTYGYVSFCRAERGRTSLWNTFETGCACGRWIFSDTVTFIGQCDKTEQMLSPGDGWYHRIGSNAHDRELVCRGAWTLVTVEVFATCQVREAQVSSIFDRWPTSVPKSMTSSMRANRC